MLRIRTDLPALAAAFSIATLGGCANAGVSPQTGALSRSAQTSPRKPSEVIRTKTWVVHKGESFGSSGDLIVFASEKVEIDGSVVIAADQNFAFFTPDFELNGQIQYQDDKKVGKIGDDFISACTLNVNAATSQGASYAIQLPPGHSLILTASRRGCTARVNRPVTLLPAFAGGSDQDPFANANGELGGYIIIGSPSAVRLTDEEADKYTGIGDQWHAYGHAQLDLTQRLQAGDGGRGADSTNLPTDTRFTAGNGGPGGDVYVDVGQLNQLAHKSGRYQDALVAGKGGDGGNVYPTCAASGCGGGTATHPQAQTVTFVEGEGGRGGWVDVATTRSTKHPGYRYAGNGGNAGDVRGSAGIDYRSLSATSGAALNAASAIMKLAIAGAAGRGGNDPKSPALPGSYPTNCQVLSANSCMSVIGGDALAGFGGVYAGGNGGSFTLVAPFKNDSEWPKGLIITLGFNDGDGFGVGSAGAGACGAAGAAGGNGGSLHDNGFRSHIVLAGGIYYQTAGFDGGIGSSGTPAGAGGIGGKDDEGNPAGKNGPAGTTC